MGNFQACRLTGLDDERKPPNVAPPTFNGDMRDSDEPRDSSAGRAVTEPAICLLGNNGREFVGTKMGARVRLVHRTGASAEINLLGATLTSYRLANGVEVIYAPPLPAPSAASASSRSYAPATPITGGIPVIFPQFGSGGASGLDGAQPPPSTSSTTSASKRMPEHGFARLLTWVVDERQSAVQPDGSVHLVLALMDSPATRDVYGWPHAFELEYAVKLTGRSLQTSLTVTNPRLVEWAQGFQAALYTHLAVPTVVETVGTGIAEHSPASVTKNAELTSTPSTVALHGLHGASFYDRCTTSSSSSGSNGSDGGVLTKRQDGAHCASLRDPGTGDIVRGLSEGGLRLFRPPSTSTATPGAVSLLKSPLSGHALRSDSVLSGGQSSSVGQISSLSDLGVNGSPSPTVLSSDEGAPSSWPSSAIDERSRGSTLESSSTEEKRSSVSYQSSNRSISTVSNNSTNSSTSNAIATATDRVYLAGSGDLQTFASAELHFASTPSDNYRSSSNGSSNGTGAGATAAHHNDSSLASPSSPNPLLKSPGQRNISSSSSEPGPGDAAAAAVAAAHMVQDLDFADQSSATSPAQEGVEKLSSLSSSSPPSTPGLWGGITVVEATCHRAANATWSDPTPSPDLLVASGRCLDDPLPMTKEGTASGKGGGQLEGAEMAPLKPVICVGPGLVSKPVQGLMNGRITLTQIISFHE